ncbi:MAG: N-acetylmuramic acid 6-phosphate etherase [Verrucomicrobiota bacterium]
MSDRILGVEGGGTKTAWILVERASENLVVVDQGKLPASNFRLTSPDRLRSIFRQLPNEADRVGMFLAGCGPDDRHALEMLCAEIWPKAKIVVGSDRDSGLAAALGHGDGIAVNAGTGASVTGRRGDRVEKAGGWGHILGDAGGGYYLSVQALRFILREYDLHRAEAQFTTGILRALSLNSRDDLVRWAQNADKMEIASMARIVFEAATAGDANALKIVEEGAGVLSEYTEAVATRLHLLAPKVILLGGLFQRDSVYTHAFRRKLKKNMPDARVAMSEQSPEFGAAWLAAETGAAPAIVQIETKDGEIENLARALTEQRNPRSENLEKLSARELVDLFVEEEKFVQDALRKESATLARGVEMVTGVLRKGGRLFYVGAGTSGRLGVLDASEIPPTFGASPETVQGIMAGGINALHRSVEGAEDERGGGAVAIEERGVTEADIVCGISASGRTPFVLGALAEAKSRGAQSIFLTCNPARARTEEFDLHIDLETGPEILTGSTRLKAGTATKVALNILSTGAMVALGKVRGNLMIDLSISNDKLRDRAARLVAELTKCDHAEAVERLRACNWNLRAALRETGDGLTGDGLPPGR